MHYEFKKKLNKIDSQQNRDLLIPEIDKSLNEAINYFINLVAFPRFNPTTGFEKNQKNIEDIRTIVITDSPLSVTGNNILILPPEYLYFLKLKVGLKKGSCNDVMATVTIREHDDEFEDSIYDCSSFEWRVVNGVFNKQGIKLYANGFTFTGAFLSYIEKHPYVHNAEDFRNGEYKRLDGTLLTGNQNCILPEHTHSEIVDLAVLFATGELQISDYQIKRDKLNFNNLKQS